MQLAVPWNGVAALFRGNAEPRSPPSIHCAPLLAPGRPAVLQAAVINRHGCLLGWQQRCCASACDINIWKP